MKAGTTFSLVLKLIQKPKAIDEVIFTITNGKNKLTKSQNGADDGIYAIGINQEESELIKGSAMIEAQINYADKSVDKSLIKEIKVRDTLNTTPVDGNMPSGDDGVELVLECIEKGVALLITPESADELIEAVTALFQDTKSIAQSVRDDADAGKFDGKDGADGVDGKDGKDGANGQDGFSPTVEVKTQTADTYILNITDKNGTTETPNLKGPKGDKGDAGVSTAGNGIVIENNEVSVDTEVIATNDYVDTELADKQDKLVAGNGIKIDNNEISIDTSNFWEVIIPKVSPYEDYIMSKSGNLWINNPSWYKHCTYDIPDGVKEIKFSGKGENASYPAIIYFNANNEVIDFYGTTSSQLNNETQTIPTGTKKIVINGVNNSIFALAYKKEVDIETIITSNLYHKKISINGDSIAYGNAYTGGALKIIADNYKMTLDNVAVNGGTLTSGDNPNVHKICDTLDTMANDADYYIIMGGYNDYNYNTNLLGSITQTMTDTIDKNTVYGALELICRALLTAHPTKKIGFIIEHKILNSAYTNKKFTMQQLHNAIVEVCKKYSIAYCDLFELSQLNTEIELFKQYTKGLDGIHPTYDGYNLFYCKHIKDWLETL